MIFKNFCNPDLDSKANRTGIQLLAIAVANQMSPYNAAKAGTITEERYIYEYYLALL